MSPMRARLHTDVMDQPDDALEPFDVDTFRFLARRS
jgi:hypothetical protein